MTISSASVIGCDQALLYIVPLIATLQLSQPWLGNVLSNAESNALMVVGPYISTSRLPVRVAKSPVNLTIISHKLLVHQWFGKYIKLILTSAVYVVVQHIHIVSKHTPSALFLDVEPLFYLMVKVIKYVPRGTQ